MIGELKTHIGFMRLKNHIKFSFLALFTATCVVATTARAELTEANIIEFIHETTEVSSGQNSDMSGADISNYLEKHLHDKARFKSVITYNIPGYSAQSASMTLKKDEFIKSMGKTDEALSDYHTEIDINDIQISNDKTRATVKTTSYESGSMAVPSQPGGVPEIVPVEGISTCDQIIMYKNDAIQMYSANCKTNLNFQPF